MKIFPPSTKLPDRSSAGFLQLNPHKASSMNLRILFCSFALVGNAALAAESAAGGPSTREADVRRIEGIFGSDLPTTEKKGSVRLIVHPHLGDLTNRDYMRLLTGVRWGVTDHTEITFDVEGYIDHGLKHTSEGSGLGDLRFETKHSFGEELIPGYQSSVGLNLFFPIAHPPVGMTNGHNEYTPYFVVGRRIASHPGLTLFFETGLDLLEKTSIPGSFERNDLHSSSVFVTPGLVYTRYPYHYTLELTYATTSLLGRDNQNAFTIRPGFAWDLPPKLRFHAKGRVTVAVGLHIIFGPDGTSTGGGGKLRAEFGISRWFRRDARDVGAPAESSR
jgi:hypothetical protein